MAKTGRGSWNAPPTHRRKSYAPHKAQGLPDEVILSHINHRVVQQLRLEEVDWQEALAKMR